MNRFYEAYRNKKLAPFFGAGISMPFYSLNWCGLIKELADNYCDHEDLNRLLDKNRYQEAITVIKQNSVPPLSELDIQNKVCELYKKRQADLVRKQFYQDNNYIDFFRRDFGHYFTFNYDHFFEGICDTNLRPVHSKVLENEDIDTQHLYKYTKDNPVIWHVHGDINVPESIILSDESYQSAYQNVQYRKYLECFINSYVFLFVGVSFQDVFVQEFFEENKEYFKKNFHYILYSENESVNEEKILHDYGLHILRYSTQESHIIGIRRKLHELLKPSETDKRTEKPSKQYNFNINAKNAPTVNGGNVTMYFE